MRVRVEILKEDDKDVNATIETQVKRNEAFNIHRADTVLGGDVQVFSLPPMGRLVINAPLAVENPVYDRDQGAAVYRSQQVQDHEGADKPDPNEIIKAKEQELQELKKRQAEDAERRRADEEEKQRQALASQQAATTAGNKPVAPTPNQSLRTPPQRGQIAGAKPGTTTVDASKSPNSSPGAQPSNPATAGSSGGNTEKK